MEVHFKEGETIKCLVDVTVSSIHKEANKKAGKITSGVAMVGEQRKDKDYARYLHDGDVIGFAITYILCPESWRDSRYTKCS